MHKENAFIQSQFCTVYLQYIYKYACNNFYYAMIKPAAVAQSRVKCCCGTEFREV